MISYIEPVTDKPLQPDDAMIIDEPASNVTETSTWPITLVNNMAVPPYDDEGDLDLSYW